MKALFSVLPVRTFFLLFLLIIGSVSTGRAQDVLSDKDLYSKGYTAFTRKNYKDAALYLFAYIQKSPAAMTNDAGFASLVKNAYQYSTKRVTIGGSSSGDGPCPCVTVKETANKPTLKNPSLVQNLTDIPELPAPDSINQ